MIKISQMKDVKPFTCDSFVIGEEYVCAKTTYDRYKKELIEEFVPATITHIHEPQHTIIAEVFDKTGYNKDIVFAKTEKSRGLFTAKPEIKYPDVSMAMLAVSSSFILVRHKNEWQTIKYMRNLAEVLNEKIGNTNDAFNVRAMNLSQLESLRKIILQIEYNRDQAAFYKGYSATLDFYGGKVGYGTKDEWNCSFFDKHGNLHRFLAKDFESMKKAFEKAVDRLEAFEKYGVVEYHDSARVYDKETSESMGEFENIYKAKAFIKNKLSQSKECGKIATGENNAD